MEKKTAEKAQKYFATGVSMITSTGQIGKNVMAAEWTTQISYDPILIAVFVHRNAATFKNIRQTREFGVNVASDEQTSLVNLSGGYSRIEIDKFAVRNSFRLLKSKYIRAPLIAGSTINAECKLMTMKNLGDHTMLVGKVISIRYNKTKKPLIYHQGRYYRIGSIIEPFRYIIQVNRVTFDWFLVQSNHKFVLKCVGLIIKSDKKILTIKYNNKDNAYETIPYLIPKRGMNYSSMAQDYLKKTGLKVTLKHEPMIKRLVLQNKSRIQRINFVLFEGKLKSSSSESKWKNIKSDPLLEYLAN